VLISGSPSRPSDTWTSARQVGIRTVRSQPQPDSWQRRTTSFIEHRLFAPVGLADTPNPFVAVQQAAWWALNAKPPPTSGGEGALSYWMISSARASTDGGIVSPNIFAVFMLMTSSNFVGCSTGRSAGLAPLRILSTWAAARRRRSGTSAP
jgi:hypothetical protein